MYGCVTVQRCVFLFPMGVYLSRQACKWSTLLAEKYMLVRCQCYLCMIDHLSLFPTH